MNDNDINYYKKQLEITKIQVADLENELKVIKKQLEDEKQLTSLQNKQIEEFKYNEQIRAIKFDNLKNKLGPLYSVLLKAKKILDK